MDYYKEESCEACGSWGEAWEYYGQVLCAGCLSLEVVETIHGCAETIGTRDIITLDGLDKLSKV